MYSKPEWSESHLPTLHAFIRSHPLGILTTAIPSPSYPLIQSTHLPWLLDTNQPNLDNQEKGKLRGHIARQNPQAKAIIDSLPADSSSTLPTEIMILFTSPVQHYVTPKFYTATKPATGKVAPTWNYAAVQVYGRVKVFHDSSDPETEAFLSTQLQDLAAFTEREMMGYTGEDGKEEAWRVDEAPEGYLRILKKNIVGLEVEIDRIEGKFKMSQERAIKDREGVIKGFEQMGTETATQMADMVKSRGELNDQKKSTR
ncbi:hypothetical protein ASPWEDRAFT_23326 [Aspergillus wentii DTO 134E9]|uniref:Transcriptional regulator n=1 Tax=Aspergillus wentii DTO 134E9 TaxID=1073089 RepID=A0A1L9S249_ASPWE|nr:uncharacterized protein ASPWEDRAFT_23326 [Aspergillus wentii DTO 134E9]KAI9923992.1 hypothetical protein MW887_007450 [Aspergillus wentii]OJJ41219.1 hypothetical protein ASPWEDRAFT_23326 [Aspergillus wentii DTO 134E9]